MTDSVDLPGEDSVALVSPHAAADEQDAEASVRPRRLAEFIAQHRVREQLQLLLTSALRRGAPPDAPRQIVLRTPSAAVRTGQ